MKIDKPGIYDLTREQYDADPCPQPSLNASTAKVLLDYSPLHAWLQHVRLNKNLVRDQERKFDIGQAAHDVLLNGGKNIAVIDADDWRTKAAKEAREIALAEKKMPIKRDDFAAIELMARVARAQIAQSEELANVFAGGKPEQTLIWLDDGIWCRARVDWMSDNGNICPDYKTTAASANPEIWGARMLFDQGCDLQAAFYMRGLRALTGKDWHFRFIVQETSPPCALSFVALSPAAQALGEARAWEALRQWRFCTENDYWPGYPRATAFVELPPWIEKRWMERDANQQIHGDLLKLGMEVQAP